MISSNFNRESLSYSIKIPLWAKEYLIIKTMSIFDIQELKKTCAKLRSELDTQAKQVNKILGDMNLKNK